jgi:predicted alpha/beta hydrolase
VAETALDDVFIDDITFPATDGYLLRASLYLPRRARRNAVLINSATAVPRKIYKGFASYLASRGCAVLTYDYRGIGDSRQKSFVGYNQPRSLVGFPASMSEWAARDVTAAGAWMRERYKNMPLTYVGHSFGGQALGLLPNNTEISRALLIAAQAAYWRLMTAPERYRVYLMLNFIGTPHPADGLCARLERNRRGSAHGVFLQWARWVMSKRYLFDDRESSALVNFRNYRGALRALCLSDDPWATRPAVELAVCWVHLDDAGDPASSGSVISASSGRSIAIRFGKVQRNGYKRNDRDPNSRKLDHIRPLSIWPSMIFRVTPRRVIIRPPRAHNARSASASSPVLPRRWGATRKSHRSRLWSPSF